MVLQVKQSRIGLSFMKNMENNKKPLRVANS